MIKSQEKLSQITHPKLKGDFENESEHHEKILEEKILDLQEIQNVLLK